MKKIFAALIFVFTIMIALPIQAQQNFVPLTAGGVLWDGSLSSTR